MRLLRSHADGCCGSDVSQPAGEKRIDARNRLSQTLATGDRRKKQREKTGGFGEDAREERKRPQRGKIRTLPCAGIIQIRFKGYISPATHGQSSSRLRCAAQDPRVSSRNNTPGRSVLATICNTPVFVRGAYCIMATTAFSRMRSDVFSRSVRQTRGGSCRLSMRYRASASPCPTLFRRFRHVVLPCPFCRDVRAACAPYIDVPRIGRRDAGGSKHGRPAG
jgi:hypothetical protein